MADLPQRPRTMVAALRDALKTVEVAPSDQVTVNLAHILAKSVDSGRMQDAPKLLATMTALGLNPAGRKPAPSAPVASSGGNPSPEPEGGDRGVGALARLRQQRSQRGPQ